MVSSAVTISFCLLANEAAVVNDLAHFDEAKAAPVARVGRTLALILLQHY
jgi:hypothetical protein